jgi:phosphatidylinositol dimannoside acyltransferase
MGKSPFTPAQAARVNQWVVHGGNLTREQLDKVVTSTFSNTGRFLFDFYHNLSDPKAVLDRAIFSPSFLRYVDGPAASESHLFVCPHITSVDLIGRAAALYGMKLQVLSYPLPPGGYEWTNEIRRQSGLIVTPMSVTALREATERLMSGGNVLTGVDRPVSDKKYRPRFFGRPASLPVGHVRLAIKVGLPVIVIYGSLLPDGRYLVEASDPIEMKRYDDLHEEIVCNAEKILIVVADAIRKNPDQWTMFYPVWPEVVQELPKPYQRKNQVLEVSGN